MGIRLNTNTWRAPLQLIDCWLPLQPARPPALRAMPLLLQRFTRAGWLKPTRTPGVPAHACTSTTARQISTAPPHPRCVRVHSSPDLGRCAPATGGRLALSGRISDVCAELDRLAALEQCGDHNRPATA